jgi:hypothetical protein
MGGDQNEEVNLVELDFAENNFTGNIPNDFGKLIKLTWLKLFMNKFSGEIPQIFHQCLFFSWLIQWELRSCSEDNNLCKFLQLTYLPYV